jgi:hypothetical protein
MSTTTTSSSSSSSQQSVRDNRKDEEKKFQDWVNNLYIACAKITDEELLIYYDLLKYQGFDRDEVLRDLMKAGLQKNLMVEAILVCALRGPKAASIVTLSDGKSLASRGIKASGAKGGKGLTCARITSATADIAAFFLKRVKVPKRISSADCPSWLQFPSAGSIKMPESYRKQHIEFSKLFSRVIGGSFNEQIYQAMIDNSYLDDRLNLFKD